MTIPEEDRITAEKIVAKLLEHNMVTHAVYNPVTHSIDIMPHPPIEYINIEGRVGVVE